MRNWIRILLGFLTLSCNAQTNILTEKEFAKVYLDSLKGQFPSFEFKIVDNFTIIAMSEEKKYLLYLDNAFKEYNLQPDSINEIINRYINSTSHSYKEKESIQIDRIIPVIKPVEFLDCLRQLGKEEEKVSSIVYEKYNDQLIVVFAEDADSSIDYFNQADFRKLNINEDTLIDFSIKNLKRLLPDIQKIGDNGSFGIAAGGDYESSLILVSKLWTKENYDVDGDFVIAIPNKDLLMVTGSENLPEIEKIRGIAVKMYETGNHPISPYLFRWNGARFEKYE